MDKPEQYRSLAADFEQYFQKFTRGELLEMLGIAARNDAEEMEHFLGHVIMERWDKESKE